jgi:hypothetical protein
MQVRVCKFGMSDYIKRWSGNWISPYACSPLENHKSPGSDPETLE